MSIWNKIFGRRSRSRADPPIRAGRMAEATTGYAGNLSPYRSRTASILKELRRIPDEANAIDFLRKKVPDVSMALWNFVRLSNQGHEMHFYDANNRQKLIKELEDEWREFASRINEISNAGLDGLINTLHTSAYLFGNQIIEVEVSEGLTDIVDVHVIDPRTIYWELEEREGKKVWIPYQNQAFKGRVSLEKANIFYVPTDPDINDPRGNLLLAPALQPTDFQMQTLQDLQAVLHRQGWPRNDIAVSRDSVANHMPAEYRVSAKKQHEWYTVIFEQIKDVFRNVKPDSDYVHYDDVTVNMTQGANANRSLDVRAVTETVDVQIMNALKQLGTFVNRHSGRTETYSTVEFSITVNGIKSIQRGSKRLIESIARLWLRVKGIQAIPVFSHNEIDYVSELQRMDIKLKNVELYAKAQACGWISPDRAAQEVMGEDKAYTEVPTEQIRVSFGVTEDENADQHKHKDKQAGFGKKVSYLR